MPEGLREDPYHWTELPSLNKDYYYYYYYYYIIIYHKQWADSEGEEGGMREQTFCLHFPDKKSTQT